MKTQQTGLAAKIENMYTKLPPLVLEYGEYDPNNHAYAIEAYNAGRTIYCLADGALIPLSTIYLKGGDIRFQVHNANDGSKIVTYVLHDVGSWSKMQT